MIGREPEKFETGIEYIEKLATELKALETPELKEVEREHVWGTSGEFNRIASSGAEALIRHADELMGRLDGDSYSQMYGDPDPWLVEHYVKMGETEEVEDWDVQEKAEADHYHLGRAEMIGYHPIDKPETDWIENQPLSFQLLIQTIRKSKTYSELKEMSDVVKKTTWDSYRKEATEVGLSEREISAACALVAGRIQPYRRDGEPNGRIKYAYRVNDEGLNRIIDFWYHHIPPMTRDQRGVFYTYRNIGYGKFGWLP